MNQYKIRMFVFTTAYLNNVPLSASNKPTRNLWQNEKCQIDYQKRRNIDSKIGIE